MVKFIFSEKATKFCKILTSLLSVCTVDKSKVEILQNFVPFSAYVNFKDVKSLILKLSPQQILSVDQYQDFFGFIKLHLRFSHL